MKAQLLAFVLALFIASPALAESLPNPEPEPVESDRAWTLQVDPLTTALGFVHLQVERRLVDQLSIYVGPHLRLFSPPIGDPEDFYGYGVEAGLRWFFLGGAPEGWWAQVRGVAAYLTTDTTNDTGGYASVLAGYTHIFDSGFLLAGGAGVQYLFYTIDGLGPSGVAPALHTTLGWAF